MANNGEEGAPMQRLKLEARDGVIITVDRDVACKSRLLQNMLNDLGIDEAADGSRLEEPLPITACDGHILQKVMDYCVMKRHSVYVPRGSEEDQRIALTAEDEAYLDVPDEELVQILLVGANYLDIPEINDIVTQKIANMMKDKSPEELRLRFGFKDDLPLETKNELHDQYAWMDN